MSLTQQNKAVIDTNILISALVFGGNSRNILMLCQQKIISGFISQTTLVELRRTIAKKFSLFLDDLTIFEQFLGEYFIIINDLEHSFSYPLLRDQDDMHVLICAKISGAHWIVSGDKDLLALRQWEICRIVSPAQFLTLIK